MAITPVLTDYAPPPDGPAVLFRDDHLLVIDKPAGLLSVPGKGDHLTDCVMSRLQAADPAVRLVHRLDRDTSGVMVWARSAMAQRHLGLQFETRVPTKTYVARVWGRLEPPTGTVDLPLIVDWPNRPLQMVDHARGRPAVTDWRVVRHDPGPPGETTRVRLTPRTGRSHQLRVHMRELGHPILGDPFYATGPAQDGWGRLMLHAEGLKLRHPDGGHWMTFSAPCPF